MSILVFDTATEKLSAALKAGGDIFSISVEQGFKHSEKLLPSIEKLFELSGTTVDELEFVGCTRGPGSFTGLRIGMATAKGLAFGKKIPVISVPTLDFLSRGYEGFDGAVLPVIDARKNRFYTAVYSKGKRITDYIDATPLEIAESVGSYSKVLLTGPHCGMLMEKLDDKGKFTLDPFFGISKINFLIDICENLYNNGVTDSDSQGPVYIRKSDAEEALSTRK